MTDAAAVTLVAIDGPSGVGKSTVGRAVARRLGIAYVDTGAMYRAVGLAARRAGHSLPLTDPEGVADLADRLEIDLRADPATGVRVFLGHEEVSAAIREPEISLYASAVSAISRVRRRLVRRQQEIGRARGGVLEGRDIGTVVFPETPFKFFLDARPEVRASRRVADLASRGVAADLQTVLREQEARDRADSTREDSPLTCDERYRRIDTSDLSIDEVVGTICGEVETARR